MITKKCSLQGSLSDFSQNITSFTEIKNSLYGSIASLKEKMQFNKASSSAPSTVKNDSKSQQENSNV